MINLPLSVSNTLLQTEKIAPDMAVGAGIVLNGYAVFEAAKAGIKNANLIKKKYKNKKDYIKIAKSFAMPVTLSLAGSAMIGCGFIEEKKRYLGASATAIMLGNALREYRRRVVEEEGHEKDHHYMYGSEYEEEVTETRDENGKKVKNKTTVENIKGEVPGMSPYSYYWGQYVSDGKGGLCLNERWDANENFNLTYLSIAQSTWNDILHKRGHVLLNEVLDDIGLHMSQIAGHAGWLSHNGKNFIDFGLYHNERKNIKTLLNGKEGTLVLDFNVEGDILRLL